jgi:zinc protease
MHTALLKTRLKHTVLASLLLCALPFLCAPARALTLPKGVTQGRSAEGITEYRLANGLKVLLFPDASKPTTTVNMTYLVGSRHENTGETGMAHLLEHMLFKGAPGFTDISKQFAARGMRFNGTTSEHRTNYFETFKADDGNLQWSLDMEAARMTTSFVARKDLDSEMTVVRNEFEAGESNPGNVLFKELQSIAYDWHGVGHSTIGNRSDIENVPIDHLQAFYRMYYQPDNAVLLVAGKFDEARTLARIQQAFGKIPAPKRTLPKLWTDPSSCAAKATTRCWPWATRDRPACIPTCRRSQSCPACWPKRRMDACTRRWWRPARQCRPSPSTVAERRRGWSWLAPS